MKYLAINTSLPYVTKGKTYETIKGIDGYYRLLCDNGNYLGMGQSDIADFNSCYLLRCSYVNPILWRRLKDIFL